MGGQKGLVPFSIDSVKSDAPVLKHPLYRASSMIGDRSCMGFDLLKNLHLSGGSAFFLLSSPSKQTLSLLERRELSRSVFLCL